MCVCVCVCAYATYILSFCFSQHVFGVVEESSVAVVIDRPDTTDTTWEKLKNDMVLWSEEQLSRITRVNMFW